MTTPDTVDIASQTPQKATGLARACARRIEGLQDAGAESDRDTVSPADFEAVARAIEEGTPAPRETIATIIQSEPKIRRIVVAAAVRALGATKWWYDSKRKRRIVEPDFALSFRACEFFADRVDGKPAQSLLTFNVNADANSKTERDRSDPVNWSPALVRQLERQITVAKEAEKKRVGANLPSAPDGTASDNLADPCG